MINSVDNSLAKFKNSIQHTKHLAKTLVDAKIERFEFDPSNKEDRSAYLIYTKTGKWVKHYHFKMPDMNVVSMIQRKLIEYSLSTEMENSLPIINSINESKTSAYRVN